VAQDAQKTQSDQVNNNILLSETAKIESKPQLEIYADDVKCSHGSTTGMLDSEAIFYMRSRGISEKAAQGLLIQAFTQEIVNEIDAENYGEVLNSLITQKLI
jgi:Fe-S cluster assembly protein SufD